MTDSQLWYLISVISAPTLSSALQTERSTSHVQVQKMLTTLNPLVLLQSVFVPTDTLTHHCVKSTGATNYINNDSVLFKCPSKSMTVQQ